VFIMERHEGTPPLPVELDIENHSPAIGKLVICRC
jgi:hypothetical protein